MEPELVQAFLVRINQGRLARIQAELEGCQSLLWLPRLPAVPQAFIPNSFVESVLVDEKEFILCLDKNVRIRKLSKRFHVRQFVEFTVEGGLFAWTTGVAQACMAVQISLGRGECRRHRFFWKVGEHGLTQR